MTSHHLLYLAGEPGVGKTTIMRTLVDSFVPARWPHDPVQLEPERGHCPARMMVRSPEPGELARLVELGRRRESGFSGTDALPMAVVGDACTYFTSGQAHSETGLVLAEGARIANRRFLTAARDAGWQVTLVLLAGEAAAARNRAARGSDQAASFIKGRRSASANLARAVAGERDITTELVQVSEATTVQEATARVARAAHHALITVR